MWTCGVDVWWSCCRYVVVVPVVVVVMLVVVLWLLGGDDDVVKGMNVWIINVKHLEWMLSFVRVTRRQYVSVVLLLCFWKTG